MANEIERIGAATRTALASPELAHAAIEFIAEQIEQIEAEESA